MGKVETACASHISSLYNPSHDDMGVNFAPRKSIGIGMDSVRSLDDDLLSDGGESSAGLSDVTSDDGEEDNESVRSRLSGLSMRVDGKQNDEDEKRSRRKRAAKKQEPTFKPSESESAWVNVHVTAMQTKSRMTDDFDGSPKTGISGFTNGDDSSHTDDRSSSGLIVGFGSQNNKHEVDDKNGLIVGFGDR